MPLPNPDRARKIISSLEEERRLKAEAERAKKKKETTLRKRSKDEVQALLMNALKIAYEGRSFFAMYRNEIPELQKFIEEGLEDLGFEVYRVSAGIKDIEWQIESINEDQFHPILQQYEIDIDKLVQHINSWLSVRYKRDGLYEKISSKLIPLIFDQVKISDQENNWDQIIGTLDSWCNILEGDEPGTYLLASLVLDDDGFNEASSLTDMVLNAARENALATHSKHLRKLATTLQKIQIGAYRDLRTNLELLESLDRNATLMSWVQPSSKVKIHGALTAWVLSWISRGEGREFLDDFSLEVESLARLGAKELDLGESVYQLEKVGLNIKDLLALLSSLDFDVHNDQDGIVVRWS